MILIHGGGTNTTCCAAPYYSATWGSYEVSQFAYYACRNTVRHRPAAAL